MASQNSGLPEGTDSIINGAGVNAGMASGGAGGTSAGSGGNDTGGGTGGGGSSSGFVAGGQGGGDDTGGVAGGGLRGQVRQGAASLQEQAGTRVRAFADSGKGRATDALDELSRVVEDAAQSIDDRLGPQYGDYARKAAESVSSLATSLRGKEVDDLLDDAREIVRKSPAVAIGTAAVVGFALVRLVKSGLGTESGGGNGGTGGTGGSAA